MFWYNSQMELKENIDIIDKKANIVNRKLIAFLAIAGGTWLYGINADKNVFIMVVSSAVFCVAISGITFSLIKLGELQNDLKELLKHE